MKSMIVDEWLEDSIYTLLNGGGDKVKVIFCSIHNITEKELETLLGNKTLDLLTTFTEDLEEIERIMECLSGSLEDDFSYTVHRETENHIMIRKYSHRGVNDWNVIV